MASTNSSLDLFKMVQARYNGKTIKGMLLTGAYTPNKDTDEFRDEVTAHEVAGGGATGYTAGGEVITATVTHDTANDRVVVTFESPVWDPSNIVDARWLYVYESTGVAADDPWITSVDHGAEADSVDAPLTFNIAPLYYNN